MPLAQFAGITAALGVPFPLKAVLAIEGLTAARWSQADQEWTARLDADPNLMAKYQAEFARAEDRLANSVEPIDSDLSAWLTFLATTAQAPDALSKLGISPEDVSRLQRRWDERMRAEPELERRAAELRRQGPGKLPPLRVVKRTLTRSSSGPPARPQHEAPRGMGMSFQAPAGRPDFAPPASLPSPATATMPAAPRGPRPAPTMLPGFNAPASGEPAWLASTAPASTRLPAFDEDDDDATDLVSTIQTVSSQSSALPFRPAQDGEFLNAQSAAAPRAAKGSDGNTLSFKLFDSNDIRLSVEQHASLCVEIAVDPDRAAEALARYQVSAADKEKMDAYYQFRCAAEPEVNAAWYRAYDIYGTWYASRR